MDIKERELIIEEINNTFVKKEYDGIESFYNKPGHLHLPDIMEYDYDTPELFFQLLDALWNKEKIYKTLKTAITITVFKERERRQNNNSSDGVISEYIYEF